MPPYNRPAIVSGVTKLDKPFFDNLLDGLDEKADTSLARGKFAARRGRSDARPLLSLLMNESFSGWAIGGSQAAVNYTDSSAAYTSDAMFGDRCVRMKSNGTAGTCSVTKSWATPFDASGSHVRLFLKAIDNNWSTILVNVGSSGGANASIATVSKDAAQTGTVVQIGRWLALDLPKTMFSFPIGGGVNWSAVTSCVVTLNVPAVVSEVRFHGVEFIAQDPKSSNPNGTVVFTWDDSHPSQASVVQPAMTARGWRGTLMPIPGAHGANNSIYLTNAQVQSLHGDHDWEIGAHCYSISTHGLGLPALTDQQMVDEFEAFLAWQAGYGYESSSHSYPLGVHDARTEAIVARYWRTSRIATQPLLYPETITPARLTTIQAVNVNWAIPTLTNILNRAHTDKGLVVLMGHAVVESGGDANSINLAKLTQILDAVAASGCDVLTMQETAVRMGL